MRTTRPCPPTEMAIFSSRLTDPRSSHARERSRRVGNAAGSTGRAAAVWRGCRGDRDSSAIGDKFRDVRATESRASVDVTPVRSAPPQRCNTRRTSRAGRFVRMRDGNPPRKTQRRPRGRRVGAHEVAVWTAPPCQLLAFVETSIIPPWHAAPRFARTAGHGEGTTAGKSGMLSRTVTWRTGTRDGYC